MAKLAVYPAGTFADLASCKSELMAENAPLRQQLIVLKRQVKRPADVKDGKVLERRDRTLLCTSVKTICAAAMAATSTEWYENTGLLDQLSLQCTPKAKCLHAREG
jgi:hypothetical protein